MNDRLKALTDAGFAVTAPDLLGTGENVAPKGWDVNKGYAGYTYGYNRSLLANRVHDALTLVAFAQTMVKAKQICVVGWDEFGTVAVLAKALAGDAAVRTSASRRTRSSSKARRDRATSASGSEQGRWSAASANLIARIGPRLVSSRPSRRRAV